MTNHTNFFDFEKSAYQKKKMRGRVDSNSCSNNSETISSALKNTLDIEEDTHISDSILPSHYKMKKHMMPLLFKGQCQN